MTTTTIASNPRPSTCLALAGALDLDVTVTITQLDAGDEVESSAGLEPGETETGTVVSLDDDGEGCTVSWQQGVTTWSPIRALHRDGRPVRRTIHGEVTLAPRADGLGLSAYGGQPDHWITGSLLDALHRLSDAEFSAACREIETAAIEAAEASEVVSATDEAEIEVTADSPRETDTGVRGGIDLDVTVTRGAWSADGEITLVPDAHRSNAWVSYGDGPDTWVSSDLLKRLRRAFPEYEELRAVLGKLLDAGRAAVEAAE